MIEHIGETLAVRADRPRVVPARKTTKAKSRKRSRNRTS